MRQFVGDLIPGSFTGKVTDVSKAESDGYITVLYNEMSYRVFIKSVLDSKDDGIRVIPKKGSIVFCVPDMTSGRYILQNCNAWDKILIQAGSLKLEMNAGSGEVVLNEGKNGGLININDMVAKINAIESDLNNLKTLFKSWPVTTGDGGTALKTALGAWYAKTLTKTTKSMIEDDKVKH
ncbi:MAG: hypothetical protein K9J21_10465 [Bacteroidales bacterium]|nr:hypothetical protein [Bacteroidales bacterium]